MGAVVCVEGSRTCVMLAVVVETKCLSVLTLTKKIVLVQVTRESVAILNVMRLELAKNRRNINRLMVYIKH